MGSNVGPTCGVPTSNHPNKKSGYNLRSIIMPGGTTPALFHYNWFPASPKLSESGGVIILVYLHII